MNFFRGKSMTVKRVTLHKTVTTAAGDILLFRLENSLGDIVELSNCGAGITRIILPDRYGRKDDVVLGYADEKDYLYDDACAGKTPGRFANRIAKGNLPIDGESYSLSKNNGPNALHGGTTGFHNRLWEACITRNGVKFTHLSGDNTEGYPGNVTATVEYTWNDNRELGIIFTATTDKATAVNLTNHAYFNLDGINSLSCLEHTLRLDCPYWLASDNTDIPTGEVKIAKNTPMDFLNFRKLRMHIFDDFDNLPSCKGYNHYFLSHDSVADLSNGTLNEIKYDGEKPLRRIATLHSDLTGRTLEVETTCPGAMIYTGNWLSGSSPAKNGISFEDHQGIAIECQYAPDAPNHPSFGWNPLRPGEVYHEKTLYRFII